MRTVPYVEPPLPEFGAHHRLIRAEFFEQPERALRIGAEVECRKKLFGRTSGKEVHAWTIRGEQRNVYTAFAEKVGKVVYIFVIVAVGAVFVFHLKHYHVAAAGNKAGAQDIEYGGKITLFVKQKFFIHAAHTHVAVVEQPRGQPAEIPFRTDIRAGADDRLQTLLRRDIEESPEIEPAAEIEAALRPLVKVPADIGFDRVEAALTELSESVSPILRHMAEIVNRTRYNGKGFPVQKKGFAVVAEIAHFCSSVILCFSATIRLISSSTLYGTCILPCPTPISICGFIFAW